MTLAGSTTRPPRRDRRIARLAIVSVAVGGVIAVALLGGRHFTPLAFHPHAPRWHLLAAAPLLIQLHIAAAVTALLVGTVLLAGVKGTRLHRALGWTWCVVMLATAVSSLFIRTINPGHWSYIHFLSGWVIMAVPMGLAAIRRKNVRLHRRTMTGLFVGGLLIAGAFTFVPGRLMWSVFVG